METAIYLAFLALIPLLLFFLTKRNTSSKRLPPGSLGVPIIGQSLQLIKALRDNRGEDWLQARVQKYGPISKLNIFGIHTVFLRGVEANKFIYTCDDTKLSNQQPVSIRRLLGERNLFELKGEDHKRLRRAILTFLKPEALKQYVGKMDQEIRMHFKQHWHDNQEIKVEPLMKTLTFDVICTLLFGVERGARRDKLVHLFEQVMEGMLAVPINLPFTRLNRCLRARSQAGDIIMQLMREKKEQLQKQEASDHQDLISSLLSMRDEANNSPLLSDEEIVSNSVLAMLAGHDTTSVLLTILIKLLAENPHVYETVLNEQEEVAKGKAPGDLLTWDDLAQMKYTWRVATEALRMYPPVIFAFRRVVQDIDIEGYIIPKGWQVFWAGCMTHMDESIYPEPYKFNPSRYEMPGAMPPHSFVAFGGGARMCPGYEFARIETLTMIHYLVTRFEWKLSLKENTMGRNPMPGFKEGLPIQIKIRKPLDDAM